jgi:Holliday junction resolvase-like predicted endonuclease
VSTTSLGRAAEVAVATSLGRDGYKILASNWRRPRCEIDIVAKKGGVVYFVEVKYRTSPSQGTGLDYITPQKLKQLTFAAQLWCAENNWDGDYRLLAASVKAEPLVEAIIEI